LAGGLEFYRRELSRQPLGPLRDLAERWLGLASGVADRVRADLARAKGVAVRRQPCLRDARPEHFLFQGDRVSGLVDFGAMGRESVAADLARLSSEWLGCDPSLRDLAFQSYAASRALSVTELRLVSVFEEASDLLIAGHWIRWHFLEGRTFADPRA